MPKSKRDKVVHLTKTAKKDRDAKSKLIETTREYIDQYKHIYVFAVENSRNAAFKEIRLQWPTSKFMMGKNKVLQIAFGKDEASEARKNLHLLSKQVTGQRGVFFSPCPPEEVLPKFEQGEPHYARSGFVATRTVALNAGPLPPTITTTMEPNMRKLELDTEIRDGVVYLRRDTVVCSKGDTLNPRQCKVLELIGIPMAMFRIRFLYHWHADKFTVLENNNHSNHNNNDDDDKMETD